MMKRLIPLLCLCFLGGVVGDRLMLRLQTHAARAAEEQESAVRVTPSAYILSPGEKKPSAAAADMLHLSKMSLTAHADLSEVTFTYHITPEGRSVNVGIQLYVHRDDIKQEDKWQQLDIRDAQDAPLVLKLYDGLDNTGTFTLTLDKGTYGAYRLLMFEATDGKNLDFNKLIYDSQQDPAQVHKSLNLVVTSTDKRIVKPTLTMDPDPKVTDNGNGTSQVTFTGQVKVPQDYQAEQNGFWVMAKGDGGFVQGWAAIDKARTSADSDNPHLSIPVSLTMKDVKPGLYNSQFGLFKYSWGDALTWVYPGVDYEAGGNSWEKKAPAESLPPRLRVRNGKFETLDGKPYDFYSNDPASVRAVSFVRGGNYGNALDWTVRPEFNTPGYFVLLKGMGCRFMRVVFGPERYIQQAVYRDAVDQVVQNIWAAGLYPVLSPQGLHKADTLQEKVQKSIKVVQFLVSRYKGQPAWLEICNEPFEFGTWAQWKPVAVQMVQAARRIDPDAFIIVPCEGWSKDARAAAKDPIKEVAVDLYDAHAYINPDQVATFYGPAVKAGLPLYVGEYGGNDPAYLSKMDLALQSLPGLMAAGPWAFTKKGQDSLPLIADGSTATLQFTPSGQQIADDYALWNRGKRKIQ